MEGFYLPAGITHFPRIRHPTKARHFTGPVTVRNDKLQGPFMIQGLEKVYGLRQTKRRLRGHKECICLWP